MDKTFTFKCEEMSVSCRSCDVGDEWLHVNHMCVGVQEVF